MKVVGRIRSQATTTVEAAAANATEARRLVTEQVPVGSDLIEFRSESHRDGTTTAVGIIRSSLSEPISAEGATYEEARAALKALIPDGYQLLAIGVER